MMNLIGKMGENEKIDKKAKPFSGRWAIRKSDKKIQ